MRPKIVDKIQHLLSRRFRYVANDINSNNGNEIIIFRDGEKKFAVEIYDWADLDET